MKPKAIVMDIDGTLINHEGHIGKETKAALLQAQASGIRLILASGRPLNGMLHLAKELEMDAHHGLCISFNGAKVADIQTQEELFDQTIDIETAKQVLEHAKQFDVQPLIINQEYAFVNDVYKCMVHVNGKELNIMNHEAHDNHYKLCEIDDLAAFLDFPLNKILIIGEPEYLKAHHEAISAPFKGKLNSMFTAPFYYEFTDLGIDKVKALDSVLGSMNIQPEEIMAFGDAQNDITMIRYAGVGIAMGNAVDELKAAADEITRSCDEEGIAYSLHHHLS